jgi:hypothetical protein
MVIGGGEAPGIPLLLDFWKRKASITNTNNKN